jgi:phosphate transport system permease protein
MHPLEVAGEAALLVVTVLVGGGLLGLLLFVTGDGLARVGTLRRTLDLLTGLPRELEPGGGIAPQVFNTVYLAVLSTLVVAPLGVAAAAYLARFARQGPLVEAVRVALDGLASLPSIVYGLFGFLVLVVALKLGYTLLGGALVLACLNLPLVVGITEEALRAVPRELADASLALGASRVQTLLGVTLPCARHGILSAIVLAVDRVFAESAPLIYTAGLTIDPRAPYDLSPLPAGETLAVHLWYVNSNGVVPDERVISAGAAAVLVLLAVLTNALGHQLARRTAK